MRDDALENDIVLHDMTLGIAKRMTGDETGRCLDIAESQGLGYGCLLPSVSALAPPKRVASPINDVTLGSYVDGDVPFRSHPYSTDSAVDPYTYSSVLRASDAQDVSEVWANMLYNVQTALVPADEFSETACTDPSGVEGNVVFLHLFLDALALQPCQPDCEFHSQVNHNRYSGVNKCIREPRAGGGWCG
ncbi:peptidase M36 [Mycena sp. CBHHK59/15]|nr:peptidase M36 [Mycena sp. CBHHK59/15]